MVGFQFLLIRKTKACASLFVYMLHDLCLFLIGFSFICVSTTANNFEYILSEIIRRSNGINREIKVTQG